MRYRVQTFDQADSILTDYEIDELTHVIADVHRHMSNQRRDQKTVRIRVRDRSVEGREMIHYAKFGDGTWNPIPTGY